MNKIAPLFFSLFLFSITCNAQTHTLFDDLKLDMSFPSCEYMIGKNISIATLSPLSHVTYAFNGKKLKLVDSKDVHYGGKNVYLCEGIIEYKKSPYIKISNTSGEYYIPVQEVENDLECVFNISAAYDFVDYLNAMKCYKKVPAKPQNGEKWYDTDPQYDKIEWVSIVPYFDHTRIFYKQPHFEMTYIQGGEESYLSYELWYAGKEHYVASDYISQSEFENWLVEKEKRDEKRIEAGKSIFEEYHSALCAAAVSVGYKSEEVVRNYIKMVGVEETEDILQEKIRIGMHAISCIIIWGYPDKINKTTYSSGTKEQYVYNDRKAYLYFEDDILTAISEY